MADQVLPRTEVRTVAHFVSFHKFQREKLDSEERLFLQGIVSLGQFVQSQVMMKCANEDFDNEIYTRFGIAVSLVAAHCIHKSNWGKHPVSRPRYTPAGSTQWMHANNLALVEADDDWKNAKRSYLTHENVDFNAYGEWGDFAIHFSDRLTWTHDYTDVLGANSVKEQIKLMSLHEADPMSYYANIYRTIVDFGLYEFDGG